MANGILYCGSSESSRSFARVRFVLTFALSPLGTAGVILPFVLQALFRRFSYRTSLLSIVSLLSKHRDYTTC